MAGPTFIDTYPKAFWTQQGVESERQSLLKDGNVVSCDLSQDDENYYLTWVSA